MSFVKRFSRGGGSSGYVSSLYWLNNVIPQLQKTDLDAGGLVDITT
jgi:hypothetical protein